MKNGVRLVPRVTVDPTQQLSCQNKKFLQIKDESYQNLMRHIAFMVDYFVHVEEEEKVAA